MGNFYEQLRAVNDDWRNFEFIEDKGDERLQLAAINGSCKAIKIIENPSEEVQIRASKGIGWSKTEEDFNKVVIPKLLVEEAQLEAVKRNGLVIQYIKNPSEAVRLEAVKRNGYAIQYIKNPSEAVQLEAVKESWDAIKYIENQSEAVQLEAVKKYWGATQYIKNPSEAVQLEAVKKNGYNIKYFKNPSEAVQLEAVKQDGYAIKYIENPPESVQVAAVKKYSSKKIDFYNDDIIKAAAPKIKVEEAQLEAVKGWGGVIRYLKNPSEAVQLASIKYGISKGEYWVKKFSEFEPFYSPRVLYYKEHGHFPEDEKEDFEEVEVNNSFALSSQQVQLFNKILLNIRKFMLKRDLAGEVVLCEKGGTIYLVQGNRGYSYTGGAMNVKGIKTSTKDKETAKLFIEKTVELLVNKIPFSIKNLKFVVSENDLVEGTMVDSEDEVGAIDVILK